MMSQSPTKHPPRLEIKRLTPRSRWIRILDFASRRHQHAFFLVGSVAPVRTFVASEESAFSTEAARESGTCASELLRFFDAACAPEPSLEET